MNVIMLSYIYAELYLCGVIFMLNVIYAECRYAECRGAKLEQHNRKEIK